LEQLPCHGKILRLKPGRLRQRLGGESRDAVATEIRRFEETWVIDLVALPATVEVADRRPEDSDGCVPFGAANRAPGDRSDDMIIGLTVRKNFNRRGRNGEGGRKRGAL
jgi:hypothetical protein